MANLDTFRHGILPNASDEAIHALLWSCSPYPFVADIRRLRRSIRKCLNRGGGTVDGALDYSHAELDRVMSERRATGAATTDGENG